MKNITRKALVAAIDAKKCRNFKDQAIKDVAFMILANVDDFSGVETREQLHSVLLNGAKSWKEYVYGGSLLCYNGQIAELLFPENNRQMALNRGSEYLLDKLTEAAERARDVITTAAFHGTRYWS